MTSVPASTTHPLRSPLLLFGIAAIVLIALLALAIAANRSGPADQASPALAQGPHGVVTIELGSGENISLTARGLRLPKPRESVDPEPIEAGERWTSPDGRTSVIAVRNASGVSLSSTAAGPGALAWIAGPDGPALVDGGKSPAAAVKGVPLVVAWSPDSTLIAYGSLTGEPFYLNVGSPSLIDATRSFDLSGGYVGELVWSPDGRYLGISTYTMDRKNHTTFIFDRQAGTVSRLIDGCHITWSPDSKFVAVHRDPQPEPGTWIVSVDGNEKYALSTDPTSYPEMWEAS